MNIKYIKPNKSHSIKDPIVTIQKRGGMSFSKAARKLMNLDNYKYCKLGIDENNDIYILLLTEKSEDSYKIVDCVGYLNIYIQFLVKDEKQTLFNYRDKFEPIAITSPDLWKLKRISL